MDALIRISRLLRPRSIALVGASQAANKMAGQVIPALLAGGYTGTILPINPRYTEVAGLPCYPSLGAAPDGIDHCIIAVAKERVVAVLEECRRKAIPGASIFSSGYAEADAAGATAQRALQEAAGDMVFLGPNCMGFANLVDRVIAAPASIFRRDTEAGDIALLSQSGGLAYASIGYFALQAGMRFSYVVNTGNSAGISFADLVEFAFADAATRVVVAVTEGERAAAEVVQAVRRLGLVKPVVLFKLGRGETGRRMALSHTGSLAGDDRVARDCARQAGIVCVDDIDDVLAAAELLRRGIGARQAGGLAAMSISGGNVTLFADQADTNKLDFAELGASTEERLRAVLPPYISLHNPIDITALGYEEPELHAKVMDVLVDDPAVRCIVPIITTAEDYTPVCSLMAQTKQRSACAMIALWTGGSSETRSAELLREAGIPIVRSAGLLARTLAAIRDAGAVMAETELAAATPPDPPSAGALTESQSMEWLTACRIPTAPHRVCAKDGIAAAARAIGFPVVLKADSTQTHISDQGGVILGLADEAALAAAAPRIASLPGERVLVARYLPGEELIASVFTHSAFGRLLMLGSGGRLTELLSDVRFLALPAGRAQVAAALRSTLVGRALAAGHRGAQGFEAAVDLLWRLGALGLATQQRVAQIELNPVTVGPHGAAAVDAAVTGERREGSTG